MLWINAKTDERVSRVKFIEDLKNLHLSDRYITDDDSYSGYLKFIKLLVCEEKVSFVEKIDESHDKEIKNTFDFSTLNWDSLIKRLNEEVNHVEVTLSTSGTTGKPKLVTHLLGNLKKNIKLKDENQNKVWLLCYHPFRMAGLQVFLQAFLSNSKIIFFPRDIINRIDEVIQCYGVTSMAFTPTFYKQMKSYLFNSGYEQVKSVSFGGEKASDELINEAQLKFRNAKIRTIYASTEGGSIFTSKDNIFSINDQQREFVRVDENGELLLHKNIVGASEFIKNDWYRTGDLVELTSVESFKIVGRISDFVNIGGYKVNPVHVENVILKSKYVNNVLVKSRSSSVLGSVLVAEIVLEGLEVNKVEAKKDILNHCSNELNAWEIPSMLKFVDQLNISNAGKVVRF